MKTLRESDIEKYLVKRVKELGGEIRKVKWIGRQGAPDRLVLLPSEELQYLTWEDFDAWHKKQAFYVELKAPGKAATFPANAHERKQHREHERMRKMGQRVEVVDSFEGVERVLS